MSKKILWEDKIEIKSYQVDREGKLSLPFLLSIIPELAGSHAEHLGYGFEIMRQKNMVWMLYRVKMRIHKIPKWREELNVKTWIVGSKKFFTRRDFEFFKEKEKIISAVTEWILFDFKEQKLLPISVLKSRENLFIEKYALEEEPEKINEPDKFDKIDEYEVKYSDIDILGHMNSSEYLRVVIDTYDYDFLLRNVADEITINYRNQALINEKLKILTSKVNKKTYIHHIKKENNTTSTIIKISWK